MSTNETTTTIIKAFFDGKKEFRAYYKKINFPIAFLYSAEKVNNLIKQSHDKIVNKLKKGYSLKQQSTYYIKQLESINTLIWTRLYNGRTPKYNSIFTLNQITQALEGYGISIDDMQKTWYENIGALLKLKKIKQEDFVNGWTFTDYKQ